MRLEDIKVPERWKSALSLIQDFVPDALMAGGCLRDLHNGVKAKDVDIFVPQISGTDDDIYKITKFLDQHSIEYNVKDYKMYKSWSSAFRIVGIIDAKFEGMPPVQLIVGPFPMDKLTETFDFGSSMITYDGKDIEVGDGYNADRINRTFLVRRGTRNDIVRSVERYARLKLRYPDWKFGIHDNVWNNTDT